MTEIKCAHPPCMVMFVPTRSWQRYCSDQCRLRSSQRRLYYKERGRCVPEHFGVKIHGMTHSPEFAAYNTAQQRCENPKCKNFKDYGARGIKFLFRSFEEFYASVGPRPSGKTASGFALFSLDRWPNNDGNYEPGNVRWATATEQAHNRRKAKSLSKFTDKEIMAEVRRRNLV